MEKVQRYAWTLLLLVGFGLAYYAYDNLIVIPGLDAADPERGCARLTTDPEVIEYIKFLFRIFGFWVLAVAIFVIVISVTGFRQGERWAWYSMLYLPIHILLHIIIWPWLAPLLLLVLAFTLAGLLLPIRNFFPIK